MKASLSLQTLMRHATLVLLVSGCVACHPGPVFHPDALAVGGTIAGIVTAGGTSAPVVTRTVTAVGVDTGARYDATTGPNGGYTIKVPSGRYRLEVELRAGEVVEKGPKETTIRNGDLDAKRNFVLNVRVAS